MATKNKAAAASSSQNQKKNGPPTPMLQEKKKNDQPQSTEYQLKAYLLLLATLVATVTYAAGLNLPGGVWQDTQKLHPVGDPILPDTQHRRYLVFYYCNATAFAASLVVCLLLLAMDDRTQQGPAAVLLRLVMVLDLLALMGAYAAGSCRDRFTTIYSLLLMSTVFAYIMPALVAFAVSKLRRRPQQADQQAAGTTDTDGDDDDWRLEEMHETTNGTNGDDDDRRLEEMHETLMLLTTFAVALTYVAGLNPPGGFWGSSQGPLPQDKRVSHPVLKYHHPGRYQAFFVCNTTAFVVSLIIIMLLLDKQLIKKVSTRFVTLHVLVVVALLGLVGAYVAGSSREPDNTAYVIGLGIAVLACILLQLSLKIEMRQGKAIQKLFDAAKERIRRLFVDDGRSSTGGDGQEATSLVTAKSRELVMLLATLAASITYQAGLDPPGGLWQDDKHGPMGESVLLTTDPVRYMVFFYSNSAAFVVSLVVIMMVQSTFLLQRHMLEAAMILDLFGLICAYAAGSCRDASTSVYVVALAGVVLVYVVIHIIFFTLDDNKKQQQQPDEDDAKEMDSKREVLLLLAILVATLTYQAGLTPPGGFWSATDKTQHHYAGDPVFPDNYPKRYEAFFYCNAASFMTSVALILLLVNPTLYKIGIRCYALYVCMVASMFGVVGAYTAGSSRRLRTSIYVLVLAIGLFVFVTVQVFIYWRKWKCRGREVDVKLCCEADAGDNNGQQQQGQGGSSNDKQKSLREYLMLLGILAASVTYQTGLKPPGGLWPDDDSSGHVAGNPVLHDINKRRYLAFFYSNSTSFLASIVVIVMLLRSTLQRRSKPLPLWPMHTVILLDMLGLLAAYAAGSNRDIQTTKNVIGLVIPVLAYIAAYPVYSFVVRKRNKRRNKNASLIHLPEHGTTTWEP